MSRRSLLHPLSALALTVATLATAAVLRGGTTGPIASGDNGDHEFQLLRPQGEGADDALGDAVSADGSAGGTNNSLNGVYHYWIEVPAGVSRLVVEIYDADVGAGDADDEDLEGRDRNRTAYETQTEYELFDPSGTQQTTRFTIGDVDEPAGADDAWLSFYNGTGRTVRDNFGTAAYTNNNGTNNWAGNWTETDSGGGGATGGDILITGGELRLASNNDEIFREADLLGSPGLDMGMALLRFDFRTSNNLSDGEGIDVEVSGNGGGSWTTLEVFSNDSSGSRTYDITAFIANNTRIRFRSDDLDGSEFFFLDNVRIEDGPITAGHWELRIDASGGGGGNDDINAIGIRAHDGTSGSGGTELNIYADSATTYGMNQPDPGGSDDDDGDGADYDFFPYITSGCLANKNEFDFDSGNNGGDAADDDGVVGDMTFYSRTPAGTGAATPPGFEQSFNSSQLSTNDSWRRDTFTGWVASDEESTEYGIWHLDARIEEYPNNSNYTVLYLGAFNVDGTAALSTNPENNTFRIYLPTDASDFVETGGGNRDRAVAPVKPYLEQQLRYEGCGDPNGPNPPQVGQTTCYTVTVRMVNPTVHAITFSATNLVTANVPGSGVVYAGNAQVSHGSIVSQPSVGGTGNITWNPGSGSPTTLAAGETAVLAYRLSITPTSAGQRLPATPTPGSGNGTRATFVDETGNTTQARATLTLGPLCELAVTEGDPTPTAAVVSGVRLHPAEGGGVVVEWETTSEQRTSSFRVLRRSRETGRWVAAHAGRLPALQGSEQGGVYRLLDEGAGSREPQVYLVEEREPDGTLRRHGPFRVAAPADDAEVIAAPESGFGREPRPRRARSAAAPVAGVVRAPAVGSVGQPMAAVPRGRSSAGPVRLGVIGSGLVRLTVQDLAAAAGTTPAAIDALLAKGALAISRDGKTVSWRPELSRGSVRAILFHAAPHDSLYSREAAYRLALGESGTAMETAPATLARAAVPTLIAEAHSEVDALPVTVIGPDPESDYWYYQEVLIGDDAFFGRRQLPLAAPAAAAGEAGTLRVDLQAGTTYGVKGEHEVEVLLNATPLGTLRWQGLVAHGAALPVPAGVLAATNNVVELVAHSGEGAGDSIVFIQSFDLFYRRLPVAVDDVIAFRGSGEAVALGGFAGSPVALLELGADLHQPRWLEGPWQDGFTTAKGSRYLAVGAQGYVTPSSLRPWRQAPLLDAEWLAVVPRDEAMLAAAERLAELRRDQDLDAAVVDLETIADGWGHGQATPAALRDFLVSAWAAGKGRLRYVALLGDGSLDYRDLLGDGENVVPAQMALHEGNLFPSDLRLGSPTAGVPLLAVGRIPARDGAELDAWVDKIAAFEEQAGELPAWGNQALLLSDDPTPNTGEQFAGDHERLAVRLEGAYLLDRVAIGSEPIGEARAHVQEAIAGGTAVISYLGHGALDSLAAEQLLASSDVPDLANQHRLPLLAAFTCTVNRFSVPGVPSLGETMVLAPSGGAAAVIAPSGLAHHSQSLALGELLAERLATLAGPRIGDLFVDALAEHLARGGDAALVDLYNLLGDPATAVAGRPPLPSDGAGTVGE